MTVPTTSLLAGPFTGTGADASLPFTFTCFANGDLLVVRDGVTLSYGGDYTVTLNVDQDSSPGGSINILAAANTLGASVYVMSNMAYQQPTRLPSQSRWSPKSVEKALDRLAILVKQIKYGLDRTLLVPIGETLGQLPAKAARIGKFMAFDASGNPTAASGTGNDSAFRTDMAANTGPNLVGFLASLSYGAGSIGAALKSLWFPDGSDRTVVTSSGVSAGKAGENVTHFNDVATGMYSSRYRAMVKRADIGDGTNDIVDTLIGRYQSVTNGFAWLRAEVMSGPLNPASGLPTAPASPQSFALPLREANPQNRHSNPTWESESRAFNNWVGGDQYVAETQDFSAALGTGIRRGYNIAFAVLASHSPYTNDDQQRHAKFLNVVMANPNTVAAGGSFSFATGYKPFIIAVAVSNAGSDYQVGDLLPFNSGLSILTNSDAVVRVKAVNGSGGITLAEVYQAGYYTAGFASPVGVTGGHGSGATFTYTLSTEATERPHCYGGLAGNWNVGFDACRPAGTNSDVGYATFAIAMHRVPNNQKFVVGRKADNSADIDGLKLNTSNEWELSQAGNPVRAKDALTSSHATAGVGYSTGAGGAATQLTSKSTGVTANVACGQVTMNNAALATGAVVSFTLTNSAITPNDYVDVWLKSGNATPGTYRCWSEGNANGSRTICLQNISGGSLGEALVLGFGVNRRVIS